MSAKQVKKDPPEERSSEGSCPVFCRTVCAVISAWRTVEAKSKRAVARLPPRPQQLCCEDPQEASASALAEFPYLLGDRQALPKTPEKTEMVLRFPLGFA
jgi:hypothetical protein